jgi:hypothetical protein
MVAYEIFTEDLPDYRHTVERALRDNGFEDFTISYDALGYGPHQDGKPEKSMRILVAIIADFTAQVDERMMRVKDHIHKYNGPMGQTAVMVIRFPADVKMHIREEDEGRRTPDTDSAAGIVWTNISHKLEPARPARVRRGRIVAAAGGWKRLLPGNTEVRGKIVRFLPG